MIKYIKKVINFSSEKKEDLGAQFSLYAIFINVPLLYIIGFPNNFNEFLIFNLIYLGAIEIYLFDKTMIGLHIIRLTMSFLFVLLFSSMFYMFSGSVIVLLFGENGKSFLGMLNFYKDEQVWIPFFLILESPFGY